MILIVDDDNDLVQLLRTVLTKAGHEVQVAYDGVEAYEQLKDGSFACLLLDVAMPNLNGVELLLLMQAEDIHVPTIVMAGFGDFKEDEMKQFANVVKYLQKPFELEAMTQLVERYTES